MALHFQDINSINAPEIQRLQTDGVSEGRDIDYKEQLPKDRDDDRREFRFDVASFANAGGGLLIFGVREKQGIPETFIPLALDPDKETLRLEQLLRTQVEPRIPGVQIRFVKVETGYVGLVRVPKSWMGLHLVKHNDSYRFYSRTSAGKYILNVTEIRNGFVAANEGYERLRRFRDDRLAKIIANEGPVPFEEKPKVVLHIMPLSMIDPTVEYDLHPVTETFFPPQLARMGSSSQYNFDGFVKWVHVSEDAPCNYLQFFRNGMIEEVMGRLHGREGKVVGASFVEDACIQSLTKSLAALKRLGVMPPFLVYLSLLGIQGYVWRFDYYVMAREKGAFRESHFILPEVLVPDAEQSPHTILRPLLDRLWNAAGFDKSPSYDQAGNWVRKQS